MEYRESLDILLRDSRFVLNVSHLRSVLPSLEHQLPPLSAIRFCDGAAPRFSWGFPVMHGRRLLTGLNALISEEAQKCLANPLYQENLRQMTPAELQEDAWFKILSDVLLKTLTESPALRLDSILWLYLAEVIHRRLNQDEGLARIMTQLNASDAQRHRTLDPELARLRLKDPARFNEIRLKVLRSVMARNDYANSCMKEVFDEIPNNPLNREMILNRLIYTERSEGVYRTLDLADGFLIKGYKLSFLDFIGLHRALRAIVSGILQRAAQGKPVGLDAFFMKAFVTDELRAKAVGLPPQGTGMLDRAASPQELAEAEEREKIAYLLAMLEEPVRYLFFHLPDTDKEYLRALEKHGSLPKDLLKAMHAKAAMAAFEPLYCEAIRDIVRWDFLQALKGRLRWVERRGEQYFCENRPLDSAVVVLNLDSYAELYRRSRYGTAVFFDLIGFTDRTKALTREVQEAMAQGDKDRQSFSAISLGIQRIFSIRNQLQSFGGIPQGFEGDAILDVFPRALDCLRYVAAFSENYNKNKKIRFRPFERLVDNPYSDGFRVGLATGPYSLIAIVGRSNELAAQKATERAVGHTINRASRLNSGKKGDTYMLGMTEEEKDQDDLDPLNLFRVHISAKQELNNNGIASFEDTFLELRDQVKASTLPWCDPVSRQGGKIAGIEPRFRNYTFELIFEDPKLKLIFLIRRLSRKPQLKGLEDERLVVYEYLLLEPPAFLQLLERDAAHVPVRRETKPTPTLAGLPTGPRPTSALQAPKSAYAWEDTVDQAVMDVRTRDGLRISELERGREGVREALVRQERGGDPPNKESSRSQELPSAPWELAQAEVKLEHASPAPVVGKKDPAGDPPWSKPGSQGISAARLTAPPGSAGPSGRAMLSMTGPELERAPKSVPPERSGPGLAGLDLRAQLSSAPSGFLTDEEEPTAPGQALSIPGVDLRSSRGNTGELSERTFSGKDGLTPLVAPGFGTPGPDLTRSELTRSELTRSELTQPEAIRPDPAARPLVVPSPTAPPPAPPRSPAPPSAPTRAPGVAGAAVPQENPFRSPSSGGKLPSLLEVLRDESGSDALSASVHRRGPSRVQEVVGPLPKPQPPPPKTPTSDMEALLELAAEEAGPDTLQKLSQIELRWEGEPEVRTLLMELAADLKSLKEKAPRGGQPVPVLGGGGTPLIVPARARTGTGELLREKLGELAYAVLGPGVEGEPARVVIGRPTHGRLEDVHVYPARVEGAAPWTLEPIFLRYLEDKTLMEFQKSSATWSLVDLLPSGLHPMPMDHLERLWMKLKALGRV